MLLARNVCNLLLRLKTDRMGLGHFAFYIFILIFAFCILISVPKDADAGLLVQRPLAIGLSDGLVANWTFDGKDMAGERALDRSGNGNTGLLTSGPVRRIGKIGQALEFDGSSSYVIRDESSPVTAYPATLCAWFKLDTLPGNNLNMPIVMVGNDNSSGGTTKNILALYIDESTNGNQIIAVDRAVADSSTGKALSSAAAKTNQWYFACGVFVSSTSRSLYVNAVFESTNTTSAPGLTSSAGRMEVGNWVQTSGSSAYFDGLIDEVRVYDRALSSDEIMRLYHIGATFKTNVTRTDTLTDGLVAHWTFDGPDMAGERALDKSGNGNTGLLTSGPTRVLGRIGQALEFDGTNDYVIRDEGSPVSDYGVTMCAWFKIDVLPGTGSGSMQAIAMVGRDASAGGNTFRALTLHVAPSNSTVYGSDNNIVAMDVDVAAGTTGRAATSYAPAVNQWYFACGVYVSASERSLYVNGKLEATNTTSAGGLTSPGRMEAGSTAQTSGNDSFFNGLIDDVRVYNRALSPDEILRLYHIGATFKTNVTRTDTLTDGLVAHWTFDGPDMAGERALDRSGNGNTGLLTSGPTRALGRIGQALEFDGSNSYVFRDESSSVTAYPATLCAWFKLDTLPGSNAWGPIVMVGNDSSAGGSLKNAIALSIGSANNSDFVDFNQIGAVDRATTDAATGVAQTSYAAQVRQWYHGCGVFASSSNRSMYVNGTFEANNTTSAGGLTGSAGRMEVGNWVQTAGENDYFDGLIDEVRVYNRALSSDEVMRLYRMGM